MSDTTKPGFQMLIVEDDPDIASGLEQYFEAQGFVTSVAYDGEQALEHLFSDKEFDIVLLDVMLPKKTGFEILEEAQDRGLFCPFLMLSARGEQENILKGFGLGAMDYMTKPFSVDELAARVKAILHRTQPPDRTPMEIYQVGDVTVNFSTHEATYNGQNLFLTALEFDILRYLIQSHGRIVTRKQLLRDVWGIEQDITTRTIDRHIASLRKKLEQDDTQSVGIETIYGVGYRYNG